MSPTFAIAVHKPMNIGDVIDESHFPLSPSMRGTVCEVLNHEEYLEAWADAGFPIQGVALHPPKYWYRVQRSQVAVPEQTREPNGQ